MGVRLAVSVALAFLFAGALAWAPRSVVAASTWRQQQGVRRISAPVSLLPGMRSARLYMCEAGDAAGAEGAAGPVEVVEAVEDVTAEADDRLMVGPFNLKDYNDWISVFLYSVIAWQTFGIVRDVGKGVMDKLH